MLEYTQVIEDQLIITSTIYYNKNDIVRKRHISKYKDDLMVKE